MTQNANISKFQLQIGDYIGFDIPSQDADLEDATVWCRITDVVFEDGLRTYKTVYPDGEVGRKVLAKWVGRFKTAAAFASDNKDIPAMESEWFGVSVKTLDHEWHCECADCALRLSLGGELLDIYEQEFRERGARIAAARV